LKNYPSKNDHANGIFSTNFDTTPTETASTIFGITDKLKILHTSRKSVSISSESPARHRMTQKAVFLLAKQTLSRFKLLDKNKNLPDKRRNFSVY
jgi:hypothetical protein